MTDSMTMNRTMNDVQTTSAAGGLLSGLVKILLSIGVTLLILIGLLPVTLLFPITAVPPLLAGALLLIDLGAILALLRLPKNALTINAVLLVIFTVAALAVFLSQQFATTPLITDAEGNVVPGSIASLETVELNGSEQWVSIRGHSTDLPVLLFLAGGPGGSELAMTRKYLGELEKHFIIVNWDQPGTGKSYGAVPFDELTPERYVEDAHALTLYLRERFDKEQIYIFGESWGSIPGVWLVQQYPEHYAALITTGHMVDPVENDIEMYDFAVELLTQQGRTDAIATLEENGPPPYPSDVVIGKFGAINDVINSYMHSHAHGEGTGHNLLFDSLGAPEYGLVDKVNWALGLARTFSTVYPQLYEVDFRTQATELNVPVYFIHGRWDANASGKLLEEYYSILEAPHKELIWFEDSAHTPSWDEPQHFVDVMVNTVLAETQTQ